MRTTCVSQEPEKAVRAFEAALEFNPRDGELVTRIARALVTVHDYQAAIDAYSKVRGDGQGDSIGGLLGGWVHARTGGRWVQ
jgi:cytochrome c-type biogenesis protein CcmH/NrfG